MYQLQPLRLGSSLVMRILSMALVASAQSISSAATSSDPPLSSSTSLSTSATPSPSAVFVYSSSDTSTALTFAIQIDANSSDAYIHMSAPAGKAWFAIGFGSEMRDAPMLVAYADATGTGVTLSPRFAHGHSEPESTPGIKCEVLPSTAGNVISATNGSTDASMYLSVDAVCRGIMYWPGSPLKVGEEGRIDQPMIFAVGPGWTLKSNDQNAALRRHDFYGHFTIDMRAAAVKSGATVPLPNGVNGTFTTLHASSTATGLKQDNDPIPALHGFAMCLTFAVIFPFGSLLARIFNRVRMHAIVQIFGYILVLLAFIGGIYISKQYNRSKGFRSAHQIIGLIIFVAVSAQLGFGIINHRIVKKKRSEEGKRTVFAKIHIYLGPAAILLGIINGGLGFNLAQNNFLGARYAIVIIAIALLYMTIRLTIHFCGKRRKEIKQEEIEMASGPEGYQYPQFGPPPAYPSGHAQGQQGFAPTIPPPPQYSAEHYPVQVPQNGWYATPPSNVSQTRLPTEVRPFA